MSRTTVYRSVTPKRRTSMPRVSGSHVSISMTSSFGRMLAKLTGASESLHRSRRRTRRA
jgi:hypothetical protein